ncbi:hypothetical protein C2G38_2219565 [Gigaspora rosea]|uniref:Uncharacterized protein n=1 Tax=Gigaspora rosea TaxID=44941 RepID=A0A397U5H0_9GLOM|nr:hypothetical protein C2G38_2219565 [Gigaspora rosea]
MVKAKVRSQVQQYLNPTATPLTPEAIEKLRQNRYQIETHYVCLSSARNSEQVISLSKSATKKTSKKKKVSQNEKLLVLILIRQTLSDVQARIENLREYKKQLQAES